MKDDALSPVVAFMLLLMVVVSFISLLNAYYIPSLKQQAEIEHLQHARDGITAVDNDIWRLISDHPGAVFQESVPLGGGGTIFSPLTSAGTLRLDPVDVVQISFRKNNDWDLYSYSVPVSMISYKPIGNFWIPQGYEWSMGVVNVTKGSRRTWLNYLSQSEADVVIDRFFNKTLEFSIDRNVSQHSNITNISVDIVQVAPASWNQRFVSGNGVGTISIWDEKVESLIIDQPDEMSIRINNTSVCTQSVLIDSHYTDLLREIEADNTLVKTGINESNWLVRNMTFDNDITPVNIRIDLFKVNLKLS